MVYPLLIGFKNLLLSYPCKPLTRLFIIPSSVKKARIIQNPAHIKRPVKSLDLFFSRQKSEFIYLTHSDSLHIVSGLQALPALLKQENRMDSRNAPFAVVSLLRGTLGISALQKRISGCLQTWITGSVVYWKREYGYGLDVSCSIISTPKALATSMFIALSLSAMLPTRTFCLYFTQAT